MEIRNSVLKLRGNVWNVRVYLDNETRPVVVSTGETNEKLARRKVRQIELAVLAKHAHKNCISMADLEELDLKRAERECVLSTEWTTTLPKYWQHVRAFFPRLDAVTAENLDNYVTHRRSQVFNKTRTPSDMTIRKELQVLKRAYKLALRYDRPMDGVKWPIDDFWPKFPQASRTKYAPASSRSDQNHDDLAKFVLALEGEAQAEMLLIMLTGMRPAELQRCGKLAPMGKGSKKTMDCRNVLRNTHHGFHRIDVPDLKKRASKSPTIRWVALTPFALALYKKWVPLKSKDHRKHLRATAKRLGVENPYNCSSRRDMRGIFCSVGDTFNYSASCLTTGHDFNSSHGNYVSPDPATMLKLVQFVQDYWFRKFQEIGGLGENPAEYFLQDKPVSHAARVSRGLLAMYAAKRA